MLQKYSSPEKVAAVEGIVFWKSSRSKTAALQKKKVIRNIAFLKNQLFPKCSFSQKVDVVQNSCFGKDLF